MRKRRTALVALVTLPCAACSDVSIVRRGPAQVRVVARTADQSVPSVHARILATVRLVTRDAACALSRDDGHPHHTIAFARLARRLIFSRELSRTSVRDSRHIGGKPYRSFYVSIRIDSRSCTVAT